MSELCHHFQPNVSVGTAFVIKELSMIRKIVEIKKKNEI